MSNKARILGEVFIRSEARILIVDFMRPKTRIFNRVSRHKRLASMRRVS